MSCWNFTAVCGLHFRQFRLERAALNPMSTGTKVRQAIMRFEFRVLSFGFSILVRGGDFDVQGASRSLVSRSESENPLLGPAFPEVCLFRFLVVQKIGSLSLYLINQ